MADQLSELDQLHALGDTKFGRPRGGARARDRRAGAAPAASLVSSHDGSKLSTTTINHGRRAGTPKQSVEPLVLREPSGWGGGSQVGAPPGSISELYEREIQREQQRSERQQRSGPDPRVRMLAGRRHDSSHQQPPVAQDQFRRQQLGSDKQILMAFYQNVEPAFATDERVQKIIASFKSKAAKTGADWREWMYGDLTKKRGVDPRDHWAVLTAEQPEPEISHLDTGGESAAIHGDPGSKASPRGAPIWSAARGHDKNAMYMADWDSAYCELTGEQGTPGQDVLYGRAAVAGAVQLQFKPGWLDEPLGECSRNPGVAVQLDGSLLSSAMWRHGPTAPPTIYDASDRPLMAISIHAASNQAVVAGTDHACYCVDLKTMKRRRQLYTKSSGHVDWVSCVAFLPDGSVLSGGADSKLCLWGRSGSRCTELLGHAAAISAVAVGAAGNIAVSASYDTTLRGWAIGSTGSGSQLACLRGHTAPVLDLAWPGPNAIGGSGPLISGDRSGTALLWDLASEQPSRILRGHAGHVSVVAAPTANGPEGLYFTGAQDGTVRAWDLRAGAPVAVMPLHNHGLDGCGAVVALEVGGNCLISAGADRAIHTIDPRMAWDKAATYIGHADFVASPNVSSKHPLTALVTQIYSTRLVELGPELMVLSGGGDGTLHCHNARGGNAMWTVQSSGKGAVQGIAVGASTVVTANDDGNVVVFN